MRVAMYYSNSDVRIQEMPKPRIGPGELLMKVKACGICGGDVMEWYRAGQAPLVLGHEAAGEIVEVGPGVGQYRVGARIAASHHVPCNTCFYCRNGHHTVCDTLRQTNYDPGGFAEFIRLPAINVDRGVYPLPFEMSWEEATFIEPLACAVRAQRIVGLKPGQTILVIGSGIAGLLHIRLARALGAGRILAVDVADYRLEMAVRSGADEAMPASEDVPRRLRELNAGRLADQVMVCTGVSSAFPQAFASVERGGTILLYAPTRPGVSVSFSVTDLFFRNDITITTSYAGAPADHFAARELIWTHRVPVRDLITHRLGLAETGQGFQLVAEAKNSIKVVIEPER
jgi:L-iditol 2-dehydrogenase